MKNDDLEKAAGALERGGIVVFPTETVYGLGASALLPNAVAKIFEIKRRPSFNPLIVHISSVSHLREVASKVPREAQRLTDLFWPGPLTLVLPKEKIIPDIVTAGLSHVGVRCPEHRLALQLTKMAGPIAAPSANLSGKVSPTRFNHLDPEILKAVDVAIDGGICENGIESTIVAFFERPTLLRSGAIPIEDIEKQIGSLARIADPKRPLAPGMTNKHYAPSTPLVLDSPSAPRGTDVALLALGVPRDIEEFGKFESLSETSSLREAAFRLFDCFRRLDGSVSTIVAREVPDEGLGVAINDRLRRAAQP